MFTVIERLCGYLGAISDEWACIADVNSDVRLAQTEHLKNTGGHVPVYDELEEATRLALQK